jgi:hypothetical protein
MIRTALALLSAAALSGCEVITHVQVAPLVDSSLHVTGCCVLFVEPTKTSQLSLSVDESDHGYAVKAKAKLKF